jgi:hypothetical protein
VRARRWTGPAYGLLVWRGFELGIAPILGFKQARRARPVDRLALAADHLLFGLVLSRAATERARLRVACAARLLSAASSSRLATNRGRSEEWW